MASSICRPPLQLNHLMSATSFRTLLRHSKILLGSISSVPTHYSRKVSTSAYLAQMNLAAVVTRLEEVAPPARAELWDNVGLLVEPSRVGRVERVFLTIDLTEEVMDEVEGLPGKKVGLIIAYHPPIFKSLKRLTQHSVNERVVIRAIESQIAVYSPHTAHDSMAGGVNDWLLSGLGKGVITALHISRLPLEFTNVVTLHGLLESSSLRLLEGIQSQLPGVSAPTTVPSVSVPSAFDVTMSSTDRGMKALLPFVEEHLPGCKMSVTDAPQVPVLGCGRLLTLADPTPLSSLISRVKTHLNIQHLRVASPPQVEGGTMQVTTVAVCAGSGASVLQGVKADVYLTGEMSHHEVLAATFRGTAVILCEHSNTERGFLPVFRQMLQRCLDLDMEVTISKADRDPLRVV